MSKYFVFLFCFNKCLMNGVLQPIAWAPYASFAVRKYIYLTPYWRYLRSPKDSYSAKGLWENAFYLCSVYANMRYFTRHGQLLVRLFPFTTSQSYEDKIRPENVYPVWMI